MSTAEPTSFNTGDPGPVSGSKLKAQALRATAWTFGGYFSTRALRLASNLILTRLLLPEHFGIMAIVGIVVQGIQMFSDIGIGPSIVQNKRGDEPDFLNTAWTIQVARGFILWIVACLLAFPAVLIYDNMPQLLYLIPVAALSAIIAGFNSTALFTVNRHLDLSKRTILEFTAKLLSIIAMIVAALITRSVWALVIGGLVAALVTMVFSHTLVPGFRNRFRWEPEAARDLFSFGRWIFLSTALTFLAISCDRLILGKLIPETVLGVYVIAYLWYEMPRQLVMQVSSKVIFPTMSKAREWTRESFMRRVARNRNRYVPLMILGLALMVSFGDLMIEFLYTEKYHAAGWMLPILALGLWCRILDQTVSPALMVFRRLQYNPLGSLMRLLLIAVFLPIAFHFYGILGAIVVIALGDVPNYIAYAIGLWRNKLSLLYQDAIFTVALIALLAALTAGRYAMGWGLSIDGAFETTVEMIEHAAINQSAS